MTTVDELRLIHAGLLKLLPGRNFWLCRGAVRCIILDEIQTWDDFDIITDCSVDDLNIGMRNANVIIHRTYYGGYSIVFDSGRKIDIWSYHLTLGSYCETLEDALRSFEFNVDSIAISFGENQIVDPLNNIDAIKGRQLRLNKNDASVANQYTPLKAAYLVIRHRLTPDHKIAQLWGQATPLDNVSDAALFVLARELKALPIDRSRIKSLSGEYSGFDRYAKLLI